MIRATRDNTVASLRSLQPVLDSLVAAKDNIVDSLELLLNFPFPATASNGVHGDYAGLYATVDLNITDLISGLTGPSSATTKCPSRDHRPAARGRLRSADRWGHPDDSPAEAPPLSRSCRSPPAEPAVGIGRRPARWHPRAPATRATDTPK